jgi:hypothetical protein
MVVIEEERAQLRMCLGTCIQHKFSNRRCWRSIGVSGCFHPLEMEKRAFLSAGVRMDCRLNPFGRQDHTLALRASCWPSVRVEPLAKLRLSLWVATSWRARPLAMARRTSPRPSSPNTRAIPPPPLGPACSHMTWRCGVTLEGVDRSLWRQKRRNDTTTCSQVISHFPPLEDRWLRVCWQLLQSRGGWDPMCQTSHGAAAFARLSHGVYNRP